MLDLELQVIGNLGNDAEINFHNQSKAINFSVAVNETWKDASGQKCSRTNWVRCTIWRDQSQSTNIVDYLKKGQQVIVTGTPSISPFINKENKADATLQLRVEKIKLLGPSKEDRMQQAAPITAATTAGAPAMATAGGSDEPDDLPF
jgi:single-strand DNA-binding protein